MGRLVFILICACLWQAPAIGQEALRVGVVSEIEQAGGVWSAWLSNGVRMHAVRLRPVAGGKGEAERHGMEPEHFARPRDGWVQLRIAIAGGELPETAETRGTASLVAGALRTGVGEGARIAMGDAGVEYRSYVSQDLIVLSFEAPADKLALASRVAHLALSSPEIEEEVVERWRAQAVEEFKSARNDAYTSIYLSLVEAVNPEGDARLRPISPADIASRTVEDARGWFAEHVARAPIEVGIAGDIDPADAIQAVAAALGALQDRPRRDPELAALGLGAPATGRSRIVNTMPALSVMGRLDSVVVATGVVGPALINLQESRAFIMGREVAMLRLQQLEQEHLKLFINTWSEFMPGYAHPGRGAFVLGATVREGAEKEALIMLRDALAEMSERASSDELFATARSHMLERVRSQSQSPAVWSDRLAGIELRGLSVSDILEVEDAYARITAEDVTAALGHYADERFNRFFDITLLAEKPIPQPARREPKRLDTHREPVAPGEPLEQEPEATPGPQRPK